MIYSITISLKKTKFQLHYERKPLISIGSLAKTKYKIFKREVRALNLFSSYRRLKSLKNSPLEYFAAFFTCLSANISLQTNMQNSKNGLIVLYVLFRELSIHVSTFY